jgi:hypothetical protein
MDVAVLVAHEFELAGTHGHGLGADAEKATHIDDDLAAVQMVDRADLLVIGPVDCRPFEDVRRELGIGQSCVAGVVHGASPVILQGMNL